MYITLIILLIQRFFCKFSEHSSYSTICLHTWQKTLLYNQYIYCYPLRILNKINKYEIDLFLDVYTMLVNKILRWIIIVLKYFKLQQDRTRRQRSYIIYLKFIITFIFFI